MNFFGMGPLELGLVAALALVVFGPDKLPELARQMGRVIAEIRRISSEATSEFQRTLSVDEPGVARPRKSIAGAVGKPPTSDDENDAAQTRSPEGPLPPY